MEIIQHEAGNWFKTWFDSPYYELLYKNRNKKETPNPFDLIARDKSWNYKCKD